MNKNTKLKKEIKKIWKKINAKREKKIAFPKKLTKKQEEDYKRLVRSQLIMKFGNDLK